MVDTQQRDKLQSKLFRIMPAHQKVSPQQIVNAMLEWGGNVAAAAASLGISANALRLRLRSLQLSPGQFRAVKVGASITSFTSATSITSKRAGGNGGAQNASAKFSGGVRGSSFGDMEAGTETAAPIKAAPRKQTPLRFKPAQRRQLEETVFDFQGRYRVATDENLILEQFFEECFEEWKATKLAPTSAPKRRKRNGGDK